jgi:hypothetical protein
VETGMNKQNIVAAIIAIAVLGGVGYWKYVRNKKPAEVSLDGEIVESDAKAKPAQKQCARYADELVHHVASDAKDMLRATRGGQEATCKEKFSIATLKCIREHEDANEIAKDLMDPYGCLAAHPRR